MIPSNSKSLDINTPNFLSPLIFVSLLTSCYYKERGEEIKTQVSKFYFKACSGGEIE